MAALVSEARLIARYFGKVSARVVPRVTGRARRNSSTDAAVLKRMALAGGAAPTAAHLSAARQAAQAVMESTVASAMKSLNCAAAGLRMEAATAARQARPIDLHIIIGPPPAQRKSLLSFAASAL